MSRKEAYDICKRRQGSTDLVEEFLESLVGYGGTESYSTEEGLIADFVTFKEAWYYGGSFSE